MKPTATIPCRHSRESGNPVLSSFEFLTTLSEVEGQNNLDARLRGHDDRVEPQCRKHCSCSLLSHFAISTSSEDEGFQPSPKGTLNILQDFSSPNKRPLFGFYPVPQNAPHVSAGMNPVPTPPSENDAFPTQHGWNGVNVLELPKGQRPKATDVSPWYGVYFVSTLY